MSSKKLVAYITASLPDKNFTIDAIAALREGGADFIELGIPFSDPVADGPVIEQANLQALAGGFKMQDILDISKACASDGRLLWMGYLNPFIKKGFAHYLKEAAALGVEGFIIPDMPYEEARRYRPLFAEHGVSLIDFVAPTDSDARIELITRDSDYFIYMVAYAGITGSGKEEDISAIINKVKSCTDTPLFLGFGVNEKNAKEKSRGVDGVIVGSAFVKVLLDESLTSSAKLDKIRSIAKEIKTQIEA